MSQREESGSGMKRSVRADGGERGEVCKDVTERSDTCDWCAGARVETVHDADLDRKFEVCERHLRATDDWSADYEVVS